MCKYIYNKHICIHVYMWLLHTHAAFDCVLSCSTVCFMILCSLMHTYRNVCALLSLTVWIDASSVAYVYTCLKLVVVLYIHIHTGLCTNHCYVHAWMYIFMLSLECFDCVSPDHYCVVHFLFCFVLIWSLFPLNSCAQLCFGLGSELLCSFIYTYPVPFQVCFHFGLVAALVFVACLLSCCTYTYVYFLLLSSLYLCLNSDFAWGMSCTWPFAWCYVK